MAEVNTQLPPNAVEFCDQFPEGRLCRFVNRRSGTLLDVRSLDLVNDAVPQVVGNPESSGVQYWIVTPLAGGQAIIPVPRDGSGRVLYLTPSTVNETVPVTISPFPCSWQILPTSSCPVVNGSPLTATSVPEGLYEEWTCQICWPHFRNGEPRMLDLWAGETRPNNNVVVYPNSGQEWQFWRAQFLCYKDDYDDSDHVDEGTKDTKPLEDALNTSEQTQGHETRNLSSIRGLWIENTLRATVQVLIRPANGPNQHPIYIGPWIVGQDRRFIDIWQLTRSRRPPLPAGLRFYLGVRTSEGWTYRTAQLFSLGSSAAQIAPNAFARGTPTMPVIRFD